MSEYVRHTWVDGEPITAEKLNNLEAGATDAKNTAKQAAQEVANANIQNHNHKLEGLSNVIVCDSLPETPIEGAWYLVKAEV